MDKKKENRFKCAICGKPLSAIEPRPKLDVVCGNPECRRLARRPHKTKRWVGEGEIPCMGPDCHRSVPAGYYGIKKTLFFCSHRCQLRFGGLRHVVGKCLFCGADLHGFPCFVGRSRFCSLEHKNKYYLEGMISQKCGPHAEILKTYINGFGKIHYSRAALRSARTYLISFLGFVNEKGIVDLEDVKPSHITAYIAKETGRGINHSAYVGAISVFFGWLIAEGRRKAANPVVPRIHRGPRKKNSPRPYTDQHMQEMWKVLEEHGSKIEKLAFALGEESGLRISEVGNLRLSDIDQLAQRLFIRLPTKNKTTRRPFYHEKVKRFLAEWLSERKHDCGHDHLLYNSRFQPIKYSDHLQTKIKTILAKHGINGFSFHRLRHTWATRLANSGMDPATLMELGGWKHWESMHQYVEICQKRVEEQYHAAMEKAKQDREMSQESVMSLSELAFIESPDTATNSDSNTLG